MKHVDNGNMWDLIKRIIKKNSNNEDEREVYMIKIFNKMKKKQNSQLNKK